MADYRKRAIHRGPSGKRCGSSSCRGELWVCAAIDPMPGPTLDDLRRYAIARTLFKPTTLPRAIQRLGFVQADPIRAPARAQDLTLRHRVKDTAPAILRAGMRG